MRQLTLTLFFFILTMTSGHAEISITAPAEAKAGETITINWQGPNGTGDFITIVAQGAREGSYGAYVYTKVGNPLQMTTPVDVGNYEIRYSKGDGGYPTLARHVFKVIAADVQLTTPSSVKAGEQISIHWQGPNSAGDYITVVPAGSADRTYKAYAYTNTGNPVRLPMPEKPGEYEIRYANGSTYRTLTSNPITVIGVDASVTLIGEARANEPVTIQWNGPNNPGDYLTIVAKDAREGSWDTYSYTRRGNPLQVLAPKNPGEYEIRYATAKQYITLARQPIAVLPSNKLGQLEVKRSDGKKDAAQQSAVYIILDASGSMLKKQENGDRRITTAKQALHVLLTETLPSGVPTAIRAFGHIKADSCDGEIVLPLEPLNAESALKVVNSITPKNLAKTAIADSLSRVADDLATVTGPKTVILLTDGEETCKGDPEKSIQNLTKEGIDVQVNIVGFAIDEFGLKQTFERWAHLGNGHYIDAQNSEELKKAITDASGDAYQVRQDGKVIVSGIVNGDVISLLPGKYFLEVSGAEQALEILAEELTTINLEP